LDPNDHQILADFYNSLNRSTLQWNIEENLCGQTGITCDESNPQRLIELFFFFLFFFFDLIFWKKNYGLEIETFQ